MELAVLRAEILKDPIVVKLSNLAKKENIPLFLVGGYIRDLLLGLFRRDYDFTLPRGNASSIRKIEDLLGRHFFKVGKEELDTATYRMVKDEASIDVSLFQGETLEEDLQRRDFTVNAIAFSLRDEGFHYVRGALEDIRKKVVRAVSNRSIDQDPLRMFRAIRYLCSLKDFTVDEELKREISSKTEQIKRLPGERVTMELDRILLSPRASYGVTLLYESGLLLTLMPELKRLENLGQNGHHHLDALSHTLLTIEKIPWTYEWAASRGQDLSLKEEDRLSLAYGALFHDIGKADTSAKDENGRVHFYRHQSFSSIAAEGIMERLRFSNAIKNRILHLVRNHMRIHNLPRETKETALKRLVHQIGDETPLLVLLTLADKEASRGVLSLQLDAAVEAHCLRILELFRQKEIVHPPALINGHDLIALGFPAGPAVGQILGFVRQKQVEGRIKTREQALNIIKERFGFNPS